MKKATEQHETSKSASQTASANGMSHGDHDLLREETNRRSSVRHSSNLEQSKDYCSIKAMFKDEMGKLLQNKNKSDVNNECATADCPGAVADKLLTDCESVKRIDVIMAVHKQLMDNEDLWRKVAIGPLVTIQGVYGHQQMLNDFMHIKMFHIDQPIATANEDEKEGSSSAAAILCNHFTEKYPCGALDKCKSFKGHYRDRLDAEKESQLFFIAEHNGSGSNKTGELVNEKDFVLQEECDKIQLRSITVHL